MENKLKEMFMDFKVLCKTKILEYDVGESNSIYYNKIWDMPMHRKVSLSKSLWAWAANNVWGPYEVIWSGQFKI